MGYRPTPKLTKSATGIWQCRFYDPDTKQRKQVTLRTRQKSVAVRRYNRMAFMYQTEQIDPFTDVEINANQPPEHTLRSAYTDFMHEKRHTSEANRQNYRMRLSKQLRDLGWDRKLSDITPDEIEECIFHEGSDASRTDLYVRLKAYFEFAKCNVMEQVTKPPVPRKIPIYFTRDEYDDLVDSIPAGHWIKPVVVMAAMTGMRLGELVSLMPDDLRGDWVFVRSGKGGHQRQIPLNLTARAALSQTELPFRNSHGTRLTVQHTTRVFKRLVRHAGLRDELKFHSLRHSFGTWLYRKGVPLQFIQQWMGHKSMQTTEIYAHVEPLDGKQLIELI